MPEVVVQETQPLFRDQAAELTTVKMHLSLLLRLKGQKLDLHDPVRQLSEWDSTNLVSDLYGPYGDCKSCVRINKMVGNTDATLYDEHPLSPLLG